MKFDQVATRKYTTLESFQADIKQNINLSDYTFQTLDFTGLSIEWEKFELNNAAFLGCSLSQEEETILRRKGAYIYNAPDKLPYNPFRNNLYTWQELMEGYSEEDDKCLDLRIYQHFVDHKHDPPINEALWQRIHDHAIDDGLRSLLGYNGSGMTTKKTVSIMGGHSMPRGVEAYYKTAFTAKILAENDYFVSSGGGPGIMEAANLGAYMAGRSAKDLEFAIKILSHAPKYTDIGYIAKAREVLSHFPEGTENLAIPTWFYGHEPSNLFASHIAKYFSNGLREDTLIAISLYGIVFAPGSAGTTQEIFMDATQNHYGTFNYYSPMIFLGRYRYEIETMIYPLLRQLAYGKEYQKLLYITDDPEQILHFLKKHPPVKR